MYAYRALVVIFVGCFACAVSPIKCIAQTDFPAGRLSREQLPKSRALDYEFDARAYLDDIGLVAPREC